MPWSSQPPPFSKPHTITINKLDLIRPSSSPPNHLQRNHIYFTVTYPTSSPEMALPPHTIRIKRRRNEDPVQTLLVESKRRRVDGEFCFILHDTVASSTANSPPIPGRPPSNGKPSGYQQQQGEEQQQGPASNTGIPIISTTGPTPTREDAPGDAFHADTLADAALSDREGRPIIAADKQLPITKREIKKAVSPARSVRLKKKPTPVTSRHKLSESISTSNNIAASSVAAAAHMDMAALSPTTKAEVRRYHLSKKMKIENGAFGQVSGKKRERGLVPVFMEGAGRVAKKRSKVKIGNADDEQDYDDDDDDDDDEEDSEGIRMQTSTTKPSTTKKPKTHFKERAMLQQQRSGKTRGDTVDEAKPSAAATNITTGQPKEGLEFGFESEDLARQLQDMVLDYISNQPDLNNYPAAAAPKSPVQEKRSRALNALGGGVGGGTWADVEKSMDVDMKPAGGDAMKLDSDGEEEEWVYDVYFREELKKSQDGSSAVTNGDYGVLVISNSDDEQWWYENDEDEESASDVWGSDDEDSNGS
ncbi:hypothetical protein TWF694_000479 [Orbilia ellipsospora]|uniref:Transcription factor Iwr1 domain-containing protein n=1 Tax=Orbilia ellipsospora TaxID=2528407 RepID=A0AAV9XQ50_9PEZI